MAESNPSMLPVVPEDLVTEIVAGKCVIFVGSGLSLRSGYPSWVSLLQQLLEGLMTNGLIRQKGYDELVRRLDVGNLLEVADTIRRRYGNYTDRYVSRIQNIFAVNPTPEPNEAHRLIFEIGFKGIVTTNYDTLIENLYDRSKRAYSYPAARVVKSRDINSLFYIFKAHGSILDLEEYQDKAIILTASDYANLRQQDHYSDFLDYLFTHRTLFFIGYSFSDPDINLIRENLAVSQDAIKTHYALIDADSSDISKQNFLDRLRIQSLEYVNQSGNHDEVVAYLQLLKAKVDEARVASKPSTAIPPASKPEAKTAPSTKATQTSVPNASAAEPSTDPRPQAEPNIDAEAEPPSTVPEDEVKDNVESPGVDKHPEPSLLNEPPLPHYEPKPPRKPIDILGLIGVALAALALLVGVLQVIIESQQLTTATPTTVAVAATPTSTATLSASHTPSVTPNITPSVSDTTQQIVDDQGTLTSVFSPTTSETFTATATPTASYTSTWTTAPTLTSTNTTTQTYIPTSTFTSTALPTLVTPTSTLTPSITPTPTITFTPTNIPCSTTAPNVSLLAFDTIDSEPVSLAAFMAFRADLRVINGQGDYLNAPWWDGEKCGDLTQGTAIRHFQLQTPPEKPAVVYGHEAAAYCRWQGLTDGLIGGLPTVQIWKEQREARVFVPTEKEWLQNTAQDEIADDTPYVIADTVSGVEPIYKAAIGEAGSVRQPPGVAFRCVYWKP